jgi:hypothetical protein
MSEEAQSKQTTATVSGSDDEGREALAVADEAMSG